MNRQYGCRTDTLGRPKVQVMAEEARRINPEVEVEVFNSGIQSETVAEFLNGADLFVDGMDLFEGPQGMLFQQSARNNIYATTAAPMGFSVAWMNFAPKGFSFDRYFDISDGMNELEKVISLIIGLAPHATHRSYLDLSHVNIREKHGPSVGAA